MSYTPTEWRTVEPFAEKASEQAQAHPERRDLFLCHAWDDRQGSARELHGHLKANGASVWFSEEDVPFGSLMIREIDKGYGTPASGSCWSRLRYLRALRARAWPKRSSPCCSRLVASSPYCTE